MKKTNKFNSQRKSRLFKIAWTYFKDGLFQTFGLALKAAWNRFKVVKALKNGLAYFTFEKSNGSIRNAIGTLLNNNFNYQSKGSNRKENYSVVKYWDVVSKGWRSFRIDRLISIG